MFGGSAKRQRTHHTVGPLRFKWFRTNEEKIMENHSLSKNLVPLTIHARMRMAQRNISRKELEFVVRFGTRQYGAGAIHYHLRKKDIPEDLRKFSDVSRLEGTTVVVSADSGEVITVHRNRANGMKQIGKKC